MSSVLQALLLEQCGKLSKERVHEILDFADFLLSRTSASERSKRARASPSLRAFMGGIGHGRLARDIDSDLYDGAVR